MQDLTPGSLTLMLGLQRLLAADQRAQALVLLAAGRAAVEVCPQARDRRVRICAGYLELDIAVEVPIDVLAERLSTTRGALYKTLHDARRKLRGHLEEMGLSLESLEAS